MAEAASCSADFLKVLMAHLLLMGGTLPHAHVFHGFSK